MIDILKFFESFFVQKKHPSCWNTIGVKPVMTLLGSVQTTTLVAVMIYIYCLHSSKI